MSSSYVPAALHDLREYLKVKTGLSNMSLGIINDEYDASYHHGWSQRDTDGSDYSWQESPRDWSWKTDAGRALDIGNFELLRELSRFLVDLCKANHPSTRDIREIIWSPDGVNVERWDRLGIRDTGDKSHTTHTHVSWFADAEHVPKTEPFVMFFEGDTGMDQNDKDIAWATTNRALAILSGTNARFQVSTDTGPRDEKNELKAQLDRIEEKSGTATLTGTDIEAIAHMVVAEVFDVLATALRRAATTDETSPPPA